MQTIHVSPVTKSESVPRARILVVDDDSIIAGLHAAVLELAGYEVVTSNNGEDALVQLAFDHFDLVVTDRNMPVLDGASMILALRSAGSRIPVVMVSGSLAFSPLPPDVACEISVALAKPANRGDVLAAVARALESKTSGANRRPVMDAQTHVCAQ